MMRWMRIMQSIQKKLAIMANKVYKNLNCKIDKSVSDKLEKFIADTKLSKTATVEKALEEYINKYNKTGKI